MFVSGVLVYGVLFITLIILCWIYSSDRVSCTVSSAGDSLVDGFYVAKSGSYRHVADALSYLRSKPKSILPDVFGFIDAHRKESPYGRIYFMNSAWMLLSYNEKTLKMVTEYYNDDSSSEDFLHFPPKTGWKVYMSRNTSSLAPAPTVPNCIGRLEGSPNESADSGSNIAQLLKRPVNTTLIVIILFVAYVLWAYKVEVSAVSFSYESVAIRGEYWRMVTASFAHFDLMHLGKTAKLLAF